MARDKKLARRKQAWIVFEDESGASLTPVVRRAWAPRSQTPVLRHPFKWERISMAAAFAYRWDDARTRLYFQTRVGTYNEDSLIEFMRELRRHFRGQQVILIWDGLPSHRSRLMSEFLAKQRYWLEVRRLPRLRPRAEPGRGVLGQPQGPRAGQPVRDTYRGWPGSQRPEPIAYEPTGTCCPDSSATQACSCDWPVTPLPEPRRQH